MLVLTSWAKNEQTDWILKVGFGGILQSYKFKYMFDLLQTEGQEYLQAGVKY